jgi:hypothetical protein
MGKFLTREQMEALDREEAPMYLAFGKFIHHFAVMESQFHVFFDKLSGLKESVSRAIVSGEPLSRITSLCNRIVQAINWEQERKNRFQCVVDQVNAISDFRNTLVHRGVGWYKQAVVSTNRLTAKSIESVEYLRFSVDDMNAASYDAIHIGIEIFAIHDPNLLSGYPQRWLELIREPWLYKRIAPDKDLRRRFILDD